jgi:hypothetical protein
MPNFGVCAQGCDLTKLPTTSPFRRLQESGSSGSGVSGFMKSVDEKFPLIQWKPRKDFYGNPIESLVYVNKFYVQDNSGRTVKKEVIHSDESLNQNGDTKIFTPMPNSYSVHWAWVNHGKRHAQPINLNVKFVSLPEINAINNFIDEQPVVSANTGYANG